MSSGYLTDKADLINLIFGTRVTFHPLFRGSTHLPQCRLLMENVEETDIDPLDHFKKY